MYSILVKKTLLFISFCAFVLQGCDLSVTVAPQTIPTGLPTNTVMSPTETPTQISASATVVPATLAPSATPTIQPPIFEGIQISVDPLSIVLSPGLASGVRGSQVARTDGADDPYWEITPGHTILKLEGYTLQGKFQEPQIYIYPAQAYAAMLPGTFESMHRLNNILFDPVAPINADQLPLVPFFNATQVFASNIQVISFQNGSGVRSVTEYAQYAASANNHDLFYHFQGLTSDGAYYIVAVFPLSNPMLAETSDAGAPLPVGGVPYPYSADPDADMQMYYRSVIDVLNATPPEVFTPTINQLDQLIQSMQVAQ